jgi:uncharacterized SAM-binding protein YcdF (DUF218 family)
MALGVDAGVAYHIAMHETVQAAAIRTRRGRAFSRAVVPVAVLLGLLLLLAVVREPLLAAVGSFLVVEDPLQPAAAIVALGGGLPFREMEAAALYGAGWADQVLLVPGEQREADRALQAIGVTVPAEWEVRRETLVRSGVPPGAVHVTAAAADNTLEEMCIVAQALAGDARPVILVSSPYHTRRVLLVWQHVTGGRVPGLARAARQEPFDPARWLQGRQSIFAVVREYLGLFNRWAGFPIPERLAGSPARRDC